MPPPPRNPRSRQKPPQSQRRGPAKPKKRIIRLYRSPKLILLPHRIDSKADVTEGFPHPRYPEKLAMSKAKHTAQHQEVSNVPLPLAATAPDALEEPGFGYAMINVPVNLTRLPASVHPTASAKSPTSASFSPLPPLPSLVSTPSIDYHQTLDVPTPTASASIPGRVSQTRTQETTKLSVPLIVLLSIGAGCFALGLYLLFRYWTRPRHIGRIKPSLPILEKAYSYDDDSYNQDGKESPVFGGKERSASRLGSEGPLWTWIQYSKPANPSAASEPPKDRISDPSAEDNADGLYPNKRTSIFLPPTAPAPSAARKRVSTASLYRDRESKDFGVAITGDGYPILDRSRSKLARRSKSYSVLTERKRRDSVYRPESAYDGADVSSPTTFFQPVTTPTLDATPGPGNEGRARIQSSYYAVAPYPRLSSLPVSYSIGTARKVHLSKAYAAERRENVDERPTHDGESAYAPTSPNLTLYPDDSMSVIAATRQKRRSQSEHQRMPNQLGVDSGSTKGLLEIEFGVSRMSLSDLAETPLNLDEKYIPRSHDKPPRVPSPPPLPSLTQMALAHSHPDAYSNYRSPTYSIYGLYGSDRKSNVPTG